MATHAVNITFVSGTIIFASSTNRNNADFTSTINNLNSLNLVASAVGTIQLENSSVTNAKLGDASVDADKVDGEVRFYQEVFS